MSQEMLELDMTRLLLAIQRSSNGILTTAEATKLVGEENLETLRSMMDQQKLLMPPSSRNNGGFELTFAGMKMVVPNYITEIYAEGGDPTQEALMEVMNRFKEGLGDPIPWTRAEPLKISAPSRSGAMAFLLPENDSDLFVELVQSIPHSWSWMSGELRAPKAMVVNGVASAHGGLHIDRWRQEFSSDQDQRDSGPRARIIPREEYEPMITKVRFDLLDLMARHKLPGFIRFDEAGFDAGHSEFPFRSALEVAATYLSRGYIGEIRFYSACYDNRPCGPEEVKIHFNPWVENDMGIRANRPPVIQILWKPAHGGGRLEHASHLVDLCRSSGLEEVPIMIEPRGRH